MVIAVCGMVLMTQQGGITSNDGLLQTSSFGLAQAAVAAQGVPVVAQAMPVQAQAVPMAQQVPAVAQAAAAVVGGQQLAGEAPVTATDAEVASTEATAEGEIMGGGGAAGAAPYAFPPQQPPPAPTCEAGQTPCAKPGCGEVGGCWIPDTTQPSGYMCECLVAPPITPGSLAWLSNPANQVQSPPGGEIANSGMLGMYETGKIALNLDKYLKHSASKLESQAELGRLIVNEIKAAQPCKLVQTPNGEMQCEDKAAATSDADKAAGEKKKNGLLGLGILGLKQVRGGSSLAEEGQSSEEAPAAGEQGTGYHPVTPAMAKALAAAISKVEVDDKGLPARDREEIKELDTAASEYKGDAARPAASLLLAALTALLVVFAA
uniref:Uncharacterized protein n=1 Tax=Hemiselmis tepida TaxID=464990 RepID=A0A7S0YVI0_9CRYP